MRSQSGTDRRGPGSVLRAVLVAVMVVLSVGVTAQPAAAHHTINCTPMSDIACRDLTPVVECIWDNGNGTSTVSWGYLNASTHNLFIEVGGKNKFNPGADNQGQPTTFLPGVHVNEFATTVTGTNLTWTLGNNKVSTSAATPPCLTKPVSVVGSVPALLLGAALLLAIALPVLARRTERLGSPA
jgi:hypothetical protein